MTVRTLTSSILILSTLVACGEDAGDPATRYTERGDPAVGHTVLSLDADALGGAVPVKAWYPADAEPGAALTYQVQVKMPAVGRAPPLECYSSEF